MRDNWATAGLGKKEAGMSELGSRSVLTIETSLRSLPQGAISRPFRILSNIEVAALFAFAPPISKLLQSLDGSEQYVVGLRREPSNS
jgi:hypothetical protein